MLINSGSNALNLILEGKCVWNCVGNWVQELCFPVKRIHGDVWLYVFQVKPEVFIVPLGTGNDLARVLGLGEGYSGDVPVRELLDIMKTANVTKLDRYRIFCRERTIIGSVSYRNRYWVYCIESYLLLLYRPILRASLQVHQLLMDRITHDDQRAFKRPVTRPPRTHACVLFYGPWYGKGLDGREAAGDCNLILASPDTKTMQYWSWPPSRRTPSTSRKW